MLVKLAEYALPILRQEIPLDSEHVAVAKELFVDEDATATGVFRSAEVLLSPSCKVWEPETVWMGLLDRGVEVPVINRAKFLAVQTLLKLPSFFWDANVFENTSLAFNSEPVLLEVLQEASPAQLSWAVYEATVLVHSEGHRPDFDYEPAKYSAVSAHRDGHVLMPGLLDFAQDELDKLTRGGPSKDSVQERWAALDKTSLDTLELEETPEDVQLGLLASVQLYIDDRAARFKADLARLSS